jgi:hypothetical protein
MGAELFYRRLLSAVDDFGRLDARIPYLMMVLFPRNPPRTPFKPDFPDKITVTEEAISTWLKECTTGAKPLVKLYSVDGHPYLQVANFKQRLRIMRSKYPCPPGRPQHVRQHARGMTVTPQAECAQDDGVNPNPNPNPKKDLAMEGIPSSVAPPRSPTEPVAPTFRKKHNHGAQSHASIPAIR